MTRTEKDCFAIIVKNIDKEFYKLTSIYDQFIIFTNDTDDFNLMDSKGKDMIVNENDAVLISNFNKNKNILTNKQHSILSSLITKYETKLYHNCIITYWE
jgi:hypothetical protein